MERIILHSDCNKFYASVEMLRHPELEGKPFAVGASPQSRHGIILTKNEIASKYNLTVGEPLWQAKEKCPNLVIVEPDFPLYVKYSSYVRSIYEDYSDYIEPFGLDESWLDITGNGLLGHSVANDIRRRVKKELGITVSIGVSFNKIFAKLGSDYKKPNAVTVISKSNYKNIVWPLPASDLLFVGRATTKKLNYYGIKTIGDIANSNPDFLYSIFGKNGKKLYANANGFDMSPVSYKNESSPVKSVGNSTTTSRDMVTQRDVRIVMSVLADSIAGRMREQGVKGKIVSVNVRNKSLKTFIRQCKLPFSTNVSSEIVEGAMALFNANYKFDEPIRSIGISMSDFEGDDTVQFDFLGSVEHRQKLESLEYAVDEIRNRYGTTIIRNCGMLTDEKITAIKPHVSFNHFDSALA